MKKPSIIANFFIIFLLLIFSNCDGILPNNSWISLNKDSSILLLNETEQLEASLLPKNDQTINLIWATSDPDVATVSDNGLVTGKAAGTASIKVSIKDNGMQATCKVTVIPVSHITGVTITPSTNPTILLERTYKFSAVVTPENCVNHTIIWESSNPIVASIDQNGRARAITEGETVITATSEDGGLFDSITLYVVSTPIPVTGVQLPDNLAVESFGKASGEISYEIFPPNATNKNVCWASSNPQIAWVTQDGQVFFEQSGNVDIIIMTEDGAYTDTAHISVSIIDLDIVL